MVGYKLYGEESMPPVRWKEFVEWAVIICLWFPTTIGGWLVFCGVSFGWVCALTILVAVVTAWYFSKSVNHK